MLNSALCRSGTRCFIDRIVFNGTRLAGSSLVNTFNDYFVNQVDNNLTRDASKYQKNLNNHSIFFHPVDDVEVISIISQLINSISCDSDGVQGKPVKYVSDIIAPYLTFTFNLSLTSRVFPQNMHIDKVSELIKK